MKRLLLIAAAIIVLTASAQLKPAYQNHAADAKEKLTQLQKHAPAHQLDLSQVSMKEMKSGDVLKPKVVFGAKPPKKSSSMTPFYRRPAGMFCSPLIVVDGKGFYSYGNYAFLMNKPHAPFTWEGTIGGADETTSCAWDYWIRGELNSVSDEMSITFADYIAVDDAPIFYAVDGNIDDPTADRYDYQMRSYNDDGTPCPVQILSIVKSEDYEEGIEFMYSSKTMVNGGRYGNIDGMFTRYYGADPYGDNQYGWWFGKNAAHVDGMAMAFEKPENPYTLKKVYLQAYTDMVVTAPVKMTCKIYKLNEIPDYIRDNATSVALPAEPGTLVCTGEAIVTPTTGEEKNGLIEFTLYGHDEIDPSLIYEYTPTIDYPILVCVDGYNDEGMENLVDFSAFCCIDDQTDEGYGELAYLKEGIFEVSLDQNGDTIFDQNGKPEKYFTGEYYWRGLNNRFPDNNQMKNTLMTGLTLFIGTENPFITFNYELEDGEYTFPAEGGDFEKAYEYEDTTITVGAIEFFSSNTSEDWWVTCNGSDELPDWLEVELEEEIDESGEFTGIVRAYVTASPLPDDIDYREAILRFEIPGDYKYYKFIQDIIPGENRFMVDGVYYKKVGNDKVCVTYKDKKYNTYRDNVVIPPFVTYNDTTYSVTAIGDNAFRGCGSLTCLTLPGSLTEIVQNAFSGVSQLNNLVISGDGEWQAGVIPVSVNRLYVKSGVQSINGLGVNPSIVYSYSTNPPVCDDNTFTGYSGTLYVPARSLATYFTAPYWCNFASIINNAVEPTSVNLVSPDSIRILKGETIHMNATVSPSNSTPSSVEWITTNEEVAITNDGDVTGLKVGECDIVAACLDKREKCHVTVYEILPDSICLNVNNLTLEINNEYTLLATILPENGIFEEVTWSSTNSSVATVDDDGKVKAVSAGNCDIIASCHDKQAVCHVTVVNQIVHITLDQHEAALLPNHMLTITPTMYPVSTTLSVTSSNPMIAAARLANGKIQVVGVSEGITVVTVGSADGTAVADSCLVTVYTELGDVDSDGFVSISDVTELIDYLLDGTHQINMGKSDIDNDGRITISDVTALIDLLLSGSNLLSSHQDLNSIKFDVKMFNIMRVRHWSAK